MAAVANSAGAIARHPGEQEAGEAKAVGAEAGGRPTGPG